MINLEIPYGTGIQIKCPSCGYEGLPNSKKKGMILLEIILYVCGIFPGIIYHIWRNSARICCCPKCGEVNVKEINGDDGLVNNLLKINKVQNYAFVAAVLFFALFILYIHDNNLRKINTNILDIKIMDSYDKYGSKDIVNDLLDSVDNLTDPVKYNAWLDTIPSSSNYKTEESKVENVVFSGVSESSGVSEEVGEGIKDLDNEVREKMKDILRQIDYEYGEDMWLKQDSYIGASCSGDCIDGIVNINFAKNIGWYDFTVKSHAADWSNKIIRAIPGYFDKLQINFICHDQIITSCTFTEYQTNTMVPKGCTYFGYKDTVDEAREKMENILKETDTEYSSIDGYIGTTCVGDCTKGIINVNFSKDIGWRDFTVRSHIAMLNNKIMNAIPGFFEELWISFIYDGQTVCSCIFTEYQRNTMVPKGCTYFGYKQ